MNRTFIGYMYNIHIQGVSVLRVIMNPTELKMQPTIHLQTWIWTTIEISDGRGQYQVCFEYVLWVAFSISSGSLSFVKYLLEQQQKIKTT
jgi:hypothetical protein